MTQTQDFELQTKALIDDLKAVCTSYGLGNDGNEFKIIAQVFLYKFLNDKFIYEVKKLDAEIADAENVDEALRAYNEDDYEMLMMQLGESTAQISPDQYISSLFTQQNEPNFADLFDKTLLDIAKDNSGIFSSVTNEGQKIALFENISDYVRKDRDGFCKAIINKIVGFSFENIFDEKFDFYASIFEYLIKDYNIDSGGTYAEYFTPHAVAKIMARCLVNREVNNVTCYDPSAGSGTLLMNLAHDYIVANPPFKLDFSDYRDQLENSDRFFAGVPKIPAKKKDSMAIYLLFMQHIIHSLSKTGKAAIVVPTGFITAQSGIDKKIRQKLVEEKMLSGVVSMPSNIFATTGTNVSIIFIDKVNKGDIVLIDASNLGKKFKEGKNQKTILSDADEQKIIETFSAKEAHDEFSVVLSHEDIAAKNYSFSAGQYFDVKIKYEDITEDEFNKKIKGFENKLENSSKEARVLEEKISKQMAELKYEV